MITAPARGRETLGRISERLADRATALGAALVFETLLVLLLLSLGRNALAPAGSNDAVATFDVRDQQDQDADQPAEEPQENPTAKPTPRPRQEDDTPPVPVPPQDAPAPPEEKPPPPISLARDETASFDLSKVPSRAPTPEPPQARQSYGPPAPAASPGDSEIVGTAPDGEPLYAARWYREPTDLELSGYLSTASTFGWALIACKTAPQWRVEDCVGLAEHPSGSNIERAVLAAAWQFQVRPPRRGNQSLVGSWVRIRIDYVRAGGKAPAG